MKNLLVLILLTVLSTMATKASSACDSISTDLPNGMLIDSTSGLSWSRCLYGQSGDNCESAAPAYSWVDALNKARASELGGIKNWRLPKIEELKALFSRTNSCRNEFFPGLGSSVAWSASANLDYATDAWAFDFASGMAAVNARDSKLQVLLVASPK